MAGQQYSGCRCVGLTVNEISMLEPLTRFTSVLGGPLKWASPLLFSIPLFLITNAAAHAACSVEASQLNNQGRTISGTFISEDCLGIRFHLLIREDVRWWPDRTLGEKEVVQNRRFGGRLDLSARCRREWPKVFMEARWREAGRSLKAQSPRIGVTCHPVDINSGRDLRQ